MKTIIFRTFALLLIACFVVSCGEEIKAPSAPTVDKGEIDIVADAWLATIGETGNYYVYKPAGYDASLADGYPVLYLLNGFGGNENYFRYLFSVTDAADLLISQGDMEPMLIVLPSGYNALGGSFYTNGLHPTVGASENHITGIVAAVDDDPAYNTDTTAAKRGLGGHSMGGYGAISIAMNNAGMFGSVSALAGPIAFNGTISTNPADSSYKGVMEVLPAVLLETGYDSILVATAGAGDLTEYQARMYPAADRRVTSMMFAMASAFSVTNPIAPEQTSIAAYGVDLPLGIDGKPYMATWNRWLASDCLERFMANSFMNPQAASLLASALYLDAGLADDLGLYGSHQTFAGVYDVAATGAGAPVSVQSYYPGFNDAEGTEIPADHTTHTFERMKNLLKWHSKKFNP